MKAFPVALWQVVCLLVGQWHNQSPIRVTTSFLTRHHNYGHFVTSTGAWWCFHAETFSALLAFCEGILYDQLISCWKIVELSAIWDPTTLVTGIWRRHDSKRRRFHLSSTHWGRDKMVAIFRSTFSNAFSRMKIYWFRSTFHSNLFLRVELTIFQHWFR